MFSKPNRLPSSEIKSVLRSRTRVSSRELQLIFQKNNLPASRFAVIVSKTIDKRSTARNRIKRLIRESIRHVLPKVTPGWDGVVMAKMNVAQQKQPGVEKIIEMLLGRAGLIIS